MYNVSRKVFIHTSFHVDNSGNPLLCICAHVRQPCSSALTCTYNDGLTNWHRHPGEYGEETCLCYMSVKSNTDNHTSTMFRAAPKSSRALCQKNKTNLIVDSKCNSAILLWPLPCFVLALITVEEHMVKEPELGFAKSKAALMINKCEVQDWKFL